jgi:hypothetical protein
MNDAEHNYEIYDKDLLAVIRALEEWHHYTQGAMHPVEIWTDHKNLEYFMMSHKLTQRQARWSRLLAKYEFTLNPIWTFRSFVLPQTLSLVVPSLNVPIQDCLAQSNLILSSKQNSTILPDTYLEGLHICLEVSHTPPEVI